MAVTGIGTIDRPYILTEASDFEHMRTRMMDHYKLGNDIDISEYSNWSPISTNMNSRFRGSLDGDGFALKNLRINATRNHGFFQFLGKATIKNISFEDVNHYSRTPNGFSSIISQEATNSTFENISVTGKMDTRNTSFPVSVFGNLTQSSVVRNSYVEVDIDNNGANNAIYGFAHTNSGTMCEYCFFNGNITGVSSSATYPVSSLANSSFYNNSKTLRGNIQSVTGVGRQTENSLANPNVIRTWSEEFWGHDGVMPYLLSFKEEVAEIVEVFVASYLSKLKSNRRTRFLKSLSSFVGSATGNIKSRKLKSNNITSTMGSIGSTSPLLRRFKKYVANSYVNKVFSGSLAQKLRAVVVTAKLDRVTTNLQLSKIKSVLRKVGVGKVTTSSITERKRLLGLVSSVSIIVSDRPLLRKIKNLLTQASVGSIYVDSAIKRMRTISTEHRIGEIYHKLRVSRRVRKIFSKVGSGVITSKSTIAEILRRVLVNSHTSTISSKVGLRKFFGVELSSHVGGIVGNSTFLTRTIIAINTAIKTIETDIQLVKKKLHRSQSNVGVLNSELSKRNRKRMSVESYTTPIDFLIGKLRRVRTRLSLSYASSVTSNLDVVKRFFNVDLVGYTREIEHKYSYVRRLLNRAVQSHVGQVSSFNYMGRIGRWRVTSSIGSIHSFNLIKKKLVISSIGAMYAVATSLNSRRRKMNQLRTWVSNIHSTVDGIRDIFFPPAIRVDVVCKTHNSHAEIREFTINTRAKESDTVTTTKKSVVESVLKKHRTTTTRYKSGSGY